MAAKKKPTRGKRPSGKAKTSAKRAAHKPAKKAAAAGPAKKGALARLTEGIGKLFQFGKKGKKAGKARKKAKAKARKKAATTTPVVPPPAMPLF